MNYGQNSTEAENSQDVGLAKGFALLQQKRKKGGDPASGSV